MNILRLECFESHYIQSLNKLCNVDYVSVDFMSKSFTKYCEENFNYIADCNLADLVEFFEIYFLMKNKMTNQI